MSSVILELMKMEVSVKMDVDSIFDRSDFSFLVKSSITPLDSLTGQSSLILPVLTRIVKFAQTELELAAKQNK